MARVRLYTNTGFNPVDIPESPSLLTHGDHELMDYTDMNIISAENLSQITVHNLTSIDANSVDYIWVRDNDGLDVIYVNMGIKPEGPGTFTFYLEPNALTTMLDDMTILSAIAERMHVDDDDATFYPNLEPFETSEPFIIQQVTMHPNFPNKGIPDCMNLLETVTLPPAIRSLPSGTSAQEYISQKTYENGTFSGTQGIEYDYSTPETIVIKDKEGNEVQRTVISCPQPRFAEGGAHTIYNIAAYGDQGEVASIDTGSYWIAGPSAIQGIVNRLKALGADSSIANHWAVPTAYIETQGITGQVGSIANKVMINGFEWGLVGYDPGGQPIYLHPKNNKVIYGQQMIGTVYSPISGASISKQGWEVRDEGQLPNDQSIMCSYAIAADLRPEGSPNFHWLNRNGLNQIGFPEVIEGGNWRKLPIGADTYSGSEWDKRNIALQYKTLKMSTEDAARAAVTNTIPTNTTPVPQTQDKGVLGGIWDFLVGMGSGRANAMWGEGGPGKAIAQTPVNLLPSISSLLGMNNIGAAGLQGLSYGQALKALELQAQDLNARASVPNTVINTSTSNYLRELGYNTFYLTVCSYSNNDREAFDKFLTKYGYNVGNKAFTYNDFFSRPHFNYVKLKSIIFKSDRSQWMRDVATQQLQRGVRIWHEYPTRGAIEDGNK